MSTMSDQAERFRVRRLERQRASTGTPNEIENFLARLAIRTHDRYYQPLPLPDGRTIPGYERTARTLEHLLATVNFAGTSVLDAGCYHCYVAFGAEDAGARKVTGVDRSAEAIDTARELAALWGYPTTLIQADLDTWEPPERYDVVVCSNVIHHASRPERIVQTLFAAGDLLVWETTENIAALCDAQPTHRRLFVADGARTPDLERRFYHYARIA